MLVLTGLSAGVWDSPADVALARDADRSRARIFSRACFRSVSAWIARSSAAWALSSVSLRHSTKKMKANEHIFPSRIWKFFILIPYFLTKLRPITSSSDLVSILIKVTHWLRKVSRSPPGNINNLSLTYFKSHGNMSCGDLRRINEPPVQLWCIFFARRRALDNKRELEQDESSLWSIWREAVRKITLRTASMKKSSSFLKKFPFPSWLRALEQDSHRCNVTFYACARVEEDKLS